jgi:hypothetical protein
MRKVGSEAALEAFESTTCLGSVIHPCAPRPPAHMSSHAKPRHLPAVDGRARLVSYQQYAYILEDGSPRSHSDRVARSSAAGDRVRASLDDREDRLVVAAIRLAADFHGGPGVFS